MSVCQWYKLDDSRAPARTPAHVVSRAHIAIILNNCCNAPMRMKPVTVPVDVALSARNHSVIGRMLIGPGWVEFCVHALLHPIDLLRFQEDVEEWRNWGVLVTWEQLPVVERSRRARGDAGVLRSIPQEFTLNTGHVTFFYDKMLYLYFRHQELGTELEDRGFSINYAAYLENADLFTRYQSTPFWNDYKPTYDALRIIRERIGQKLAMKPGWYRYKGEPYEIHHAQETVR